MKKYLLSTILFFCLIVCISPVQSQNSIKVIKEVSLLADTAKFEIQTISMLRGSLETSVKPNQWYYVAITKSSDLEEKLYINGALISSGVWGDFDYSYRSLFIGASFYTAWGSFYKGYLDEFRMSKVVRTDKEIADYYASNQEFTVNANTIGLWHFNENSGTSFSNSVPSSAAGSLFNDPQFVAGRFGNCLYFDGIASRGDCNLDIPEYDITFEFWFKNTEPRVGTMISAYGLYNSHIFLNLKQLTPDILWSTGEKTPIITVNPSAMDKVWVTNGYNTDTIFFNTQSATIYDTVHVAVTDTLLIKVLLTGVQAPENDRTIKVYPNPAKDFLIINTGDYSDMADYTMRIFNSVGQKVYETNITQSLYEINLSMWSGRGAYILQVYDQYNVVKAIKTIILQ